MLIECCANFTDPHKLSPAIKDRIIGSVYLVAAVCILVRDMCATVSFNNEVYERRIFAERLHLRADGWHEYDEEHREYKYWYDRDINMLENTGYIDTMENAKEKWKNYLKYQN